MKKTTFIIFYIFCCLISHADVIPLNPEPVDDDEKNQSKRGNRELIIEPRASIEEGVVLIETDVAAWGVTVTVYNSEGAVVYTAASSEDATSHEFAVGNLPAGEYVIEVQLGEDSYEGVFNI